MQFLRCLGEAQMTGGSFESAQGIQRWHLAIHEKSSTLA
jgi:hypothetical protein